MKKSNYLMVPIFMTLLMASTRVPASSEGSNVSVNHLKVDCGGMIEVISTSNPRYSPYKDHPGTRLDPKPASAGFSASVNVMFGSPGCSVLKSKYNVDLVEKRVNVQVSIKNPINQLDTEVIARESIGKHIPFRINQYFEWKTQDGTLPFFDFIHGEQIVIEAEDSEMTLYSEVEVDSKSV